MVQVTDAVTYDTVVSATFIQVLVTSNRLLERTAWQLEGTQADLDPLLWFSAILRAKQIASGSIWYHGR